MARSTNSGNKKWCRVCAKRCHYKPETHVLQHLQQHLLFCKLCPFKTKFRHAAVTHCNKWHKRTKGNDWTGAFVDKTQIFKWKLDELIELCYGQDIEPAQLDESLEVDDLLVSCRATPTVETPPTCDAVPNAPPSPPPITIENEDKKPISTDDADEKEREPLRTLSMFTDASNGPMSPEGRGEDEPISGASYTGQPISTLDASSDSLESDTSAAWCQLCETHVSAYYSDAEQLHILGVHLHKATFECALCEFKYWSRQRMELHAKQSHPNRKASEVILDNRELFKGKLDEWWAKCFE